MAEEDRLQAKRPSVHVYYRFQPLNDLDPRRRLHGPLRLAVFCSVTVLLPCLFLIAPLYIRYCIFRDVVYRLKESDLVMVNKPISTFWCEGQELRTNSSSSFETFLLDPDQQLLLQKEHFRTERNLRVSQDSLEYFGMFLPEGSKVLLSTCSANNGAKLTVLKGRYSLKNCGLPVDTDGQRFQDSIVEDGQETYEETGKIHLFHRNIPLKSRRTKSQDDTGNIEKFLTAGTVSNIIQNSTQVPNEDSEPSLGNGEKQEGQDFEEMEPPEDTAGVLNWTCFKEDVLHRSSVIYMDNCLNLDLTSVHNNSVVQEIAEEEFYYFVFHSEDEQVNTNMIHVHFDIDQTVKALSNVTRSCDASRCSVSLDFLTPERVLVRVPMQEDIRGYEDLHEMLLVSSCIPRLGVFFVFPVCILVMVLCCAFV